MQITNSQKRRVAVFFIIGAVLFLGIIGIVAGNKMLKREDCYSTQFKNVSVAGLTVGSSVKFQGMNIGHVSSIDIDSKDTSTVKIGFCLKPGVPIREGTASVLGNIGITGLKFLELKGGGKGKKIPVGGVIPSKPSSWDTISGKASVIAVKLESILNHLNDMVAQVDSKDASKIVANIRSISSNLNSILKENKSSIHSILKNTSTVLVSVNKNMNNITQITNNIKQVTDKNGPLYLTLKSLQNTSDSINKTYKKAEVDKKIKQVFQLISSLQKTVDSVNLTLESSREDINNSFRELSDGMQNFNDFTRKIMENPTTLLRNSGESSK